MGTTRGVLHARNSRVAGHAVVYTVAAMMVTPWASVLCYHGVTTPQAPSAAAMHVPEGELAAALDTIGSVAEVVPLRVLLDRRRAGRSSRGLAAVTFDDGYASLIPFLTRSRVPVTVFVTTGATERGAAFWWDRVEDLFSHVEPARWRAFEDVVGVSDAYRAGQPAEYGPLRPLRQWIMATYNGRWPDHLEEPLSEIERECAFRTPHRPMTWDELARVAKPGVVDIGVHTISHPVLPLLSDAEIVREIVESDRAIRDHVGDASLSALAIPFGLYDARTVPLASEAGMRASLTLANRSLRGIRVGDSAIPRLSMGRGLKRWKLLLRIVLPRSQPGDYPPLPSETT
jgi:peptidoglycan/xylan/chitin deacetylase (PgdA/CDA1 family)